MKIKQEFDVSIDTRRRFIIRQSPGEKKTACSECGEAMLKTEQAAHLFNIKQRRIFRIIESNAAHFTEIKNGLVMICLKSLVTFLEADERK